jgi:hypothetical protein
LALAGLTQAREKEKKEMGQGKEEHDLGQKKEREELGRIREKVGWRKENCFPFLENVIKYSFFVNS